MKTKMELLKEVTGREVGYYVDGYENNFNEHYEFLLKIKELLGNEAIKKLYDLDNEEDVEFRAILKYLLK